MQISTARSTLLVAAVVAAIAVSGTAVFRAPRPGADLRPQGDAAGLVQILQGNETILWTALSGSVASHTIQGWPSRSGDTELGGALMIERPADGGAGVIDFGEKPMSLSFELEP